MPHLVWDYAAAILDFVICFANFVKNVDFGGFRRIWRGLARSGEMWKFVPLWPVPHLVLDYAATILHFVGFGRISVDFGGYGKICRDLARSGEIWRDVGGRARMASAHPVWDYAVALLDFCLLYTSPSPRD